MLLALQMLIQLRCLDAPSLVASPSDAYFRTLRHREKTRAIAVCAVASSGAARRRDKFAPAPTARWPGARLRRWSNSDSGPKPTVGSWKAKAWPHRH